VQQTGSDVYVLEWKGAGSITGVYGPLVGSPSPLLGRYTFSASLAPWANAATWGAPTLELITPDAPVPAGRRSPVAG
jgi:hypothetical protein